MGAHIRTVRNWSLGLAAAACVLGAPTSAAAQAPARVTGIVTEAGTGTPLADVVVQLEGTTHATLTDAEGRFALDGVPAGEHVLYVSLVGYALVRRSIVVLAAAELRLEVPLSPGTATYDEAVRVEAPAFGEADSEVPGRLTLGPAEMQNLRGVLADDPMRAIQVAPGVATGDDFRAEFSIRGSDPRNIGLSLDGVPNVLIIHKQQATEDTASIALINGDLVDEVSILPGSYPQRFGNRTGAQVDITTRVGTRTRTRARAAVSGSTASLVGEGPLGGGGSWLAGFRQSYLGWLIRRIDPEAEGAASFTDGQAVVAFDLTPRQQLRFNMVAGTLRVSENDPTPSVNNDDEAASNVGVANLSWWWAARDDVSVVQRVYWAGNRFHNDNFRGEPLQTGSLDDVGYRGDLTWALDASSRVEAGWNWSRQSGEARAVEYDRATGAIAGQVAADASANAVGGYAQLRWTPSERVAINGGGRIDYWGAVDATEVSPWLQTRWSIGRSLALKLASGVFRQSPELERALGPRGNAALLPERAWHFDAGLDGPIAGIATWQLNVYNREERDVTRLPGAEVRLVDGRLVRGSFATTWQNELEGYSRGIELALRRDRAQGFSGWLGYALTYTRYRDTVTGERFWGDFDQRHTLNVWGKYRFTNRLEVAGKVRVGSNFPIGGYFRRATPADGVDGLDPEDRYFVTEVRNTTRLPTYARIDVRGNYAFNFTRSRLTLFVEVINLLNRTNYGRGDPGFINPVTFRVNNLVEALFPILPSAGILWEF